MYVYQGNIFRIGYSLLIIEILANSYLLKKGFIFIFIEQDQTVVKEVFSFF